MTGVFPSLSGVLFRRILSAGAIFCAVLLMTIHGPAPAQTNPQPDEPNYDSQLCTTLGGTVLPVAGEDVCTQIDATGTFCIVGSDDVFPCRGLYKHVLFCHNLDRPAINPFICGAVCANGAPLGGICQLPFAGAALKPGQPFTVSRGSAERAGVYHGERRGLHFIYFTESNIFRANQNRLADFADHSRQCALGNAEGKTTPWRVPTLAETAVLLADAPGDFAVVSDSAGFGNDLLRPNSEFQIPLPSDGCAGQCAPPLEGFSAAAGNAAVVPTFPGRSIRPEILTQIPNAARPAGIQSEEDLENLRRARLGPPAFIRAPHQTRAADIVFPCVAPVAPGYESPPLDSRIQITPIGAPVQTGDAAAAVVVHPSYAAPNAPDIAAGAPLFTVFAVARRLEADEGASPAFATVQTSIGLSVLVGGNEHILSGTGMLALPIVAASVLRADLPARIPILAVAAPSVGPIQSEFFYYASVPVETPPPVTAVALASLSYRPITVNADGETVTLDAVVLASLAHAEINLPPEMSGETESGEIEIISSRPGVQYEPDLPNLRLIRRGPVPAGAEQVRAKFTHPRMRGDITMLFTFRPAQMTADPGEFVPAGDLRRGGFAVSPLDTVPLFTLTSAVPATRLEFVQPLHGDRFNYHGFTHRAVYLGGGQIEFSAFPPRALISEEGYNPANFFITYNPPFEGNENVWRVVREENYKSYIGNDYYAVDGMKDELGRLHATISIFDTTECDIAPGGNNIELQGTAAPGHRSDIYQCPARLCAPAAASENLPPEVLKCPEYFSRVEIDGDFVVATPKQGGGYDYAPYDETKRTEGALNSVPMVVNNPQACVPVAQARAAGIIPPENPLSDANGPTTKYGGEIMFCPPLRRVATVIVAAQNSEYESRPWTTKVRNSLGVLVPQTIYAAALLTLEITVSVRREAAEFDPDLYFPPDATADFLRNSQSRGERRYHPARAVPDFASQLSVLTVDNGATIHVIRHPVMAVNIPPNHRYDIVMPAHGGFALTVLPRGKNTFPLLPPGDAPPRQTPQFLAGEVPVAYPNRPAEFHYVESENPDSAKERLAVFYVPPNRPIPAQTSRRGVVRFTVVHLSETNGETVETVAGAAQFTLSLTAVAKMPVHDAGRRYLQGSSIPETDVIPPEMLGMRDVFPELIDDNLMKDGTMTYLGARRPVLRADHAPNRNAFALIERDDRPVAYQLQINTTLTNSNGTTYDQLQSVSPAVSGDHILSLKYANPNVFLGEYLMTFRANIPPMDAASDYWDNPRSLEEFVRVMLTYDAAFYATLTVSGIGLAINNWPLENYLRFQSETADLFRQVDAALDSYLLNPQTTVLMGRQVAPDDYNGAIQAMAVRVLDQIYTTDGGALNIEPYLPYSLGRYGKYEGASASHDSRVRDIADILKYHVSDNARIKTVRVAEGYAGPLFIYDPKDAHPFQSVDISAKIHPDAPNYFEATDGLAGMRRRLPNGGILEIVETGDGRLQARIPEPLPRITSGGGLESYIRSTVVNFVYPIPEPPASLAPPSTVAIALPTIRAKGDEGDGEYVDISRVERGTVSWIAPDTFLLESFPYDLTLGASVLMRPTLYAYAPEGGREILLSLQITVREIRSYATVDAVVYFDLTAENGAHLPPLEIPEEDATAGKSFEIRLPDAWRYPRGGEWSVAAGADLEGLALRGGRVAVTSALSAGFYPLSLEYAPRNSDNLLGRVPYVFALNVLSLKTEQEAAADLANAAAAGNRAEVSRLLRESPLPGEAKAASGPYAGKTPLHAALMGFASSDSAAQTEARIHIVWELVENGANWWTVDDEGLAPMHRALLAAAQNETVMPIRALATAPFAPRDKRGRIATKGAAVTVDFPVATGPENAPMADDELSTPLEYAAAQYDAALDGGDDAAVDAWSAALSEFDKLYGLGCQRSTDRLTALCLSRRVEERRRDELSGETPLHTAVRTQSTMTVEALLAEGADVNAGLISAVDIGGSPSPMHYAVSLANPHLVSLMAIGFKKEKVGGKCPLGIIPTVSGVGFSGGSFAATVSECLVRTNYKPGGSWLFDAVNYPSVALTPPTYATVLLAEALAASPRDAVRITLLQRISLMLNPEPVFDPDRANPDAALAMLAVEAVPDLERIEKVLGFGADANGLADGVPLLITTAALGNGEVVRLLLKAGADPAVRWGDTTLPHRMTRTSGSPTWTEAERVMSVFAAVVNSERTTEGAEITFDWSLRDGTESGGKAILDYLAGDGEYIVDNTVAVHRVADIIYAAGYAQRRRHFQCTPCVTGAMDENCVATTARPRVCYGDDTVVPGAPTNLSVEVSGNDVTVYWDSPLLPSGNVVYQAQRRHKVNNTCAGGGNFSGWYAIGAIITSQEEVGDSGWRGVNTNVGQVNFYHCYEWRIGVTNGGTASPIWSQPTIGIDIDRQ